MTPKAKQLLDEAITLSPDEREELATALYESLLDTESEEAWGAEIERRIAEVDQGIVKPIPWSEARRQIFEDADDDQLE